MTEFLSLVHEVMIANKENHPELYSNMSFFFKKIEKEIGLDIKEYEKD